MFTCVWCDINADHTVVGTQTGGRGSALPLFSTLDVDILRVAIYSGVLLLVVVEVFVFF